MGDGSERGNTGCEFLVREKAMNAREDFTDGIEVFGQRPPASSGWPTVA